MKRLAEKKKLGFLCAFGMLLFQLIQKEKGKALGLAKFRVLMKEDSRKHSGLSNKTLWPDMQVFEQRIEEERISPARRDKK